MKMNNVRELTKKEKAKIVTLLTLVSGLIISNKINKERVWIKENY